MPRTALSFLGTGNYGTTTYLWNEASCETRFMPVALETFFEPDELLVAVTPAAQAKHGAALQEVCTYRPVQVPKATEESAWWRMFNALAEAVPDGTTLLVDITHGFRSQPFLSLAVVLYLRVVKDVTVERIVYGAYEAGDDGTSPVVDLTSFLNLIDWTIATEQFQEYGDAAPLKDMFRAIADESRKGNRVALNLRPAGDVLQKLTRALALNRPIETIETAEGLIDVLEAAMRDAVNVPEARPIKRLMLPVARRFAPLGQAGGSVFAQRGFAAQAAMLRFYVETGQYLQAFTLAQEMLVSWVCVREGYDPLVRGSGGASPEDYTGREGARALLFDWSEARTDRQNGNATGLWQKRTAAEQRAVGLWDDLRDQRNDVAHAGFSHNPTPAKTLVDAAESTLQEVAHFLDPTA